MDLLMEAFGLRRAPEPAHVKAFRDANERLKAALKKPDELGNMVHGLRRTTMRRKAKEPAK